MRPIGYYVHHHGDGHRQRAIAIAQAADLPMTLLGTGLAGRTQGLPYVDLPDDRCSEGGFDGRDGVERPAALHYAPIDHEGIRQRVAQVSAWIAEARPSLMVIDVSVEMAMLARLASVSTIYVRLNGNRLDPAHRDAFRGASGLLAPFAEPLDDPETPAQIRAKTFYAPGIPSMPRGERIEADLVLGVIGRGGGMAEGARWAAAAQAVPDRRWRVIGDCSRPEIMPPNLEFAGWVDTPERHIAGAGLVIGAAGDGLVGSVLAAGRPFLCLPEPRPYDEQEAKARRLQALGAAVVHMGWPQQAEWPNLIARALALNPQDQWALTDPDGAGRAGAWIRSMALAREREEIA
jgi:hypothetical protein